MKKEMKKILAALMAAVMLLGTASLGGMAEEVLEIFQDFSETAADEACIAELEILQEEESSLQEIIPDAAIPEEEEELLKGFDTMLLALAREASSCGHANLYVEEAIEGEAFTSLGKEKHLHSYHLVSRSLCCGDCETIIQTVDVNETIVETGAHDWYIKGSKLYCHDCSAVRTVKYPCKHKKLSMTEDGNLACPKCGKQVVLNKQQSGCAHESYIIWEPGQAYVSHYQKISDEKHLKVSITPVYAGESRFAVCNGCGVWLETLNGAVVSAGITDTVYADAKMSSVQENHTLENGICALCEQSLLSNTLTLSAAAEITAGKTAKCTVVNAEGTKLNAGKLIWASSNKSVATVSKGVVTAKKAGMVTISAADASGNFGTVEIRILPKAKSVTLMYNGADAGKTIAIDTSVTASIQLSAVTEPEDAADAVTWKSSNTKVAKVDKDGMVTIRGKGKATITATAKDGSKKKDSVTLNASALVKKITISGAQEIAAGKTAKLKASVEPKNAGSKAVSWKSSDTAAASVSKEGVVTAKKVSARTPVTITATAKDGSGVTARYEIIICPVVSKVSILYNGADAGKTIGIDMSETSSIQLSAVTAPEDAADAVTWKSSNSKVAKVDANGKVEIRGKGKATITAVAKDGSKKQDNVTLNVAALVKKITISGAQEITAGKTAKLKAAVEPKNATSKAVSWESSDAAAATVNKEGVVTARKVSARTPVTITATAKDGSGVTARYEIIICPVPAKVVITDAAGTALKNVELNLRKDSGALQLKAYVEPADAAQTVSWKSSNTKVAKVNENGLVTGLKKGSATITAKAANGKTASCVVKVVDEELPAAPELTYAVIEGGLCITGYTGSSTNVVIPSAIDGVPVVAIGSAAFKDFTKMTGITIPESVVSIGEDAFNNCDGLTTIELPKGVTKISARAFYGCDGLKSVYLSDNVTEIGAAAFAYCSNLKTMEPR